MTWKIDLDRCDGWSRKVRYVSDTTEYLELVKEFPDFFVVKYGKMVTMPDGCRKDYLIGETYPTHSLDEAIVTMYKLMRGD